MEKVLIVGSSRTPVGIYDGKLKDYREQALSALTVTDVLKKTGVEGRDVSELVIGIAKQTSSPSNAARYIGLLADLPEAVPAYTVQRQGASGLQAVVNGFVKIRAGSAKVILAGGAESMSTIPYEIHDARYNFSPDKIVMDPIPAMVAGGQPAAKYGKLTIKGMNDQIAEKARITKEQQEAYAAESAKKAEASKLEEEIIPIDVKVKKKVFTVSEDELYTNPGVIAGAADGAATCLLMSESTAKEKGVTPMAELVSIGISAGSPEGCGMIGKEAAKIALKKAGKTAVEMDLIEIHETTAAQSIAMINSLGLSKEEVDAKVNPYGGAMVTGNPWGAAGSIELHKLLYGLKDQNKTWGLVVCGAEGGQAIAMVIRMV